MVQGCWKGLKVGKVSPGKSFSPQVCHQARKRNDLEEQRMKHLDSHFNERRGGEGHRRARLRWRKVPRVVGDAHSFGGGWGRG